MINVECELFHFQLCLISCKSVLISWTYVLVWMFFSTFMTSFPLWVMEFLTVDELSYHIYFSSCLYVWLEEQLSVIFHNTWTGVHYSWMNTRISRDSLVSIYFLAWFGCLWVLRREVRTCASLYDNSLHSYHPALLIRHVHIIS